MVAKSNLLTQNENNKFVNDSNGDVAVNTVGEITNDETNPVPVEFVSPGEPHIYNITINVGDINTELSQVLPEETKKILIQHDGFGTIKFAFNSGYTEFITIPRGAAYTDSGLSLKSKTLYFETNKSGIVEILVWV